MIRDFLCADFLVENYMCIFLRELKNKNVWKVSYFTIDILTIKIMQLALKMNEFSPTGGGKLQKYQIKKVQLIGQKNRFTASEKFFRKMRTGGKREGDRS